MVVCIVFISIQLSDIRALFLFETCQYLAAVYIGTAIDINAADNVVMFIYAPKHLLFITVYSVNGICFKIRTGQRMQITVHRHCRQALVDAGTGCVKPGVALHCQIVGGVDGCVKARGFDCDIALDRQIVRRNNCISVSENLQLGAGVAGDGQLASDENTVIDIFCRRRIRKGLVTEIIVLSRHMYCQLSSCYPLFRIDKYVTIALIGIGKPFISECTVLIVAQVQRVGCGVKGPAGPFAEP